MAGVILILDTAGAGESTSALGHANTSELIPLPGMTVHPVESALSIKAPHVSFKYSAFNVLTTFGPQSLINCVQQPILSPVCGSATTKEWAFLTIVTNVVIEQLVTESLHYLAWAMLSFKV